jgi:hypothetical protein
VFGWLVEGMKEAAARVWGARLLVCLPSVVIYLHTPHSTRAPHTTHTITRCERRALHIRTYTHAHAKPHLHPNTSTHNPPSLTTRCEKKTRGSPSGRPMRWARRRAVGGRRRRGWQEWPWGWRGRRRCFFFFGSGGGVVVGCGCGLQDRARLFLALSLYLSISLSLTPIHTHLYTHSHTHTHKHRARTQRRARPGHGSRGPPPVSNWASLSPPPPPPPPPLLLVLHPWLLVVGLLLLYPPRLSSSTPTGGGAPSTRCSAWRRGAMWPWGKRRRVRVRLMVGG